MPQETKSAFRAASPVQVVGANETRGLQGLVASREDEAALLDALEQAFDYRGDITLVLDDGARIKGYIFDRKTGRTLGESFLRLMPEDSGDKVRVSYDRIASIEFSGKDAAAGKSFETWLKKYVEKKLAGERAAIECEPLE